MPKSWSRLSRTHTPLAPPHLAPGVAANPYASPGAARHPLSDALEASLMQQGWYRRRTERRADGLTADIVDVGVLYTKVFGWERGQGFFKCTIVEPQVYRRVLLGPRRARPDDDVADLVSLE